MNMSESRGPQDTAFNYHLLRNALDQCNRAPSALDQGQYQAVLGRAQRSFRLETLVLHAPEASNVVIPEDQLEAALARVEERYDSEQEFLDDLAGNGLSRDSLREALRRELLFDAVMQRVASHAASVDDIDLRLFYELHGERFTSPELRSARHILITINPDYAENTREAALARVTELAHRLSGGNARGSRFGDLARRHSECPSALEGGRLGEVRRGTLYPELDARLFSMAENEISEVLESEAGFHLLFCERIQPARRAPFNKVKERIREILLQRRQRNCQKHFLSELQKNMTEN